MSYILDALRRADAEREGASVHGGFGQAHPDDADDADLPAPASPWVWMAAGMLLVVLAGVFWRWVLADVPASPVPVPVMPVPAAQPSVAPPPTPPVAIAAPAVAPREAPAPVVAAPAAPVLPLESHPAPKPAAAAVANRLAERAPAPAPPQPERPPAPEVRIYQLNELPDDVRRQLPQLTVGGAMYSDKPANRMVILNGQLFHEGDALTPNLSLRQIKLKSAVLEFRGFRYELNY